MYEVLQSYNIRKEPILDEHYIRSVCVEIP